jgi:hypothetical protein
LIQRGLLDGQNRAPAVFVVGVSDPIGELDQVPRGFDQPNPF